MHPVVHPRLSSQRLGPRVQDAFVSWVLQLGMKQICVIVVLVFAPLTRFRPALDQDYTIFVYYVDQGDVA